MDKVAVAAGSFQSELGCSGANNGDWQPDCVRSLLTDSDGDGIYAFAASGLPAGSYEFKIAFNEKWGGDVPANNVAVSVGQNNEKVTISWTVAGNAVVVKIGESIDPELAALATAPVRLPIVNDIFYFVMPDRFANGSVNNDNGGLTGARSVTGFDPTDKGYYHGSDLAGLAAKLDYLKGMGVTAIWMTPIFKNKLVQGLGTQFESTGYHGYWITDFTQIDPHFGTNAEPTALIQ
jgi:hypothetical protein